MAMAKPVLIVLVLVFALTTLGATPVWAQRRGDCRGAQATGWQGQMASETEPGERLRVSGRVLDSTGKPMAGILILAYQTDVEGYYSPAGENERDARLCAVIRTNESGEYSFDTIRPGAYPNGGVPEHIHFELWGDGIARQRRDLQFADDDLVPERRKRDLSRTSTVRPIMREADAWRVERDFEIR